MLGSEESDVGHLLAQHECSVQTHAQRETAPLAWLEAGPTEDLGRDQATFGDLYRSVGADDVDLAASGGVGVFGGRPPPVRARNGGINHRGHECIEVVMV